MRELKMFLRLLFWFGYFGSLMLCWSIAGKEISAADDFSVVLGIIAYAIVVVGIFILLRRLYRFIVEKQNIGEKISSDFVKDSDVEEAFLENSNRKKSNKKEKR